jgi:tetratricopeptide (TPR) repeat protein
MIGWCQRLVRRLRGRLGRVLAALLLLAVIGLALIPAGGAVWVRYHYRAAEQAFHKRDFAMAREHVDQCLRVWPRDPEALLLATRIARRAGDFDRAREHLDAYAALVGSGPALTLERLLLRAQQGDMPPHIEALLRIWVDKGHPDSMLILEVVSQQFMQNYRLSDALDALNLWLERVPDDIWALLRRGWVNERLERYENAMADYRRAVELTPDADAPRLRLAHALLYHKGDAAEALEHFKALYQHGERGPAVRLGLAQCHWDLGDQDEARRMLDDLLASRPDDPVVLTELGKIAIQAGRPAEAERHLREAVRLDPASFQAHNTLGRCLDVLGRAAEAAEQRKKADQIKEDLARMQELTHKLQDSPRDASLRCDIGRLFLRLGEPREGVAWLHRALDLDPFLQPAHEALTDYYDSIHDAAQANEHRKLAAQCGKRPPSAGSPGLVRP